MVAAMIAAIAFGRSSSEKSTGSVPRMTGVAIAAPSPSRILAPMKAPAAERPRGEASESE